MTPAWFSIAPVISTDRSSRSNRLSSIPFSQMWPDDELWFDLLLQSVGSASSSLPVFLGRVDFNAPVPAVPQDYEGGNTPPAAAVKMEDGPMGRYWLGRLQE